MQTSTTQQWLTVLYLGNLTEETVLEEDTYLVMVLLAASKVRITSTGMERNTLCKDSGLI